MKKMIVAVVLLLIMIASAIAHATEIGPPIEVRDGAPLSYFSLGTYYEQLGVRPEDNPGNQKITIKRKQIYGEMGMKIYDDWAGFFRAGVADLDSKDQTDSLISADYRPFVGLGVKHTFFRSDDLDVGAFADAEIYSSASRTTMSSTVMPDNSVTRFSDTVKYKDTWQVRGGVTARKIVYEKSDNRLILYVGAYFLGVRGRTSEDVRLFNASGAITSQSSGGTKLHQGRPFGTVAGVRLASGGLTFSWLALDAEVQYQEVPSVGLYLTKTY